MNVFCASDLIACLMATVAAVALVMGLRHIVGRVPKPSGCVRCGYPRHECRVGLCPECGLDATAFGPGKRYRRPRRAMALAALSTSLATVATGVVLAGNWPRRVPAAMLVRVAAVDTMRGSCSGSALQQDMRQELCRRVAEGRLGPAYERALFRRSLQARRRHGLIVEHRERWPEDLPIRVRLCSSGSGAHWVSSGYWSEGVFQIVLNFDNSRTEDRLLSAWCTDDEPITERLSCWPSDTIALPSSMAADGEIHVAARCWHLWESVGQMRSPLSSQGPNRASLVEFEDTLAIELVDDIDQVLGRERSGKIERLLREEAYFQVLEAPHGSVVQLLLPDVAELDEIAVGLSFVFSDGTEQVLRADCLLNYGYIRDGAERIYDIALARPEPGETQLTWAEMARWQVDIQDSPRLSLLAFDHDTRWEGSVSRPVRTIGH